MKCYFGRQLMRKLIYVLSLFFYVQAASSAESDAGQMGRMQKFIELETKYNGVAIEVFWSLQKKFGERLRTEGILVHCEEKEKANEIRPKIHELIVDGGKAIDVHDLAPFGIKKLTEKMRANLIMRAVTAASVYGFAAVEVSQFVEKLNPDYQKNTCDAGFAAYKRLKSMLIR